MTRAFYGAAALGLAACSTRPRATAENVAAARAALAELSATSPQVPAVLGAGDSVSRTRNPASPPGITGRRQILGNRESRVGCVTPQAVARTGEIALSGDVVAWERSTDASGACLRFPPGVVVIVEEIDDLSSHGLPVGYARVRPVGETTSLWTYALNLYDGRAALDSVRRVETAAASARNARAAAKRASAARELHALDAAIAAVGRQSSTAPSTAHSP